MGEAPKVALTSREPNKELRYENASEWLLTIEIPGEPKPFDGLTGSMIVEDSAPRRLALAAILKSAWSELLYGTGSPVESEYPGFNLRDRSPRERKAYFEGYQAAMKHAEESVRDRKHLDDRYMETVEDELENIADYLKQHAARMKLTSEAVEP